METALTEPTLMCSAQVTELAKALINVQRELQPAVRDRNNPFTKSNYATLNSVMAACRDALFTHNIWLSQYPIPVEPGYLGLVTKLTHTESGQWQTALAVMPLQKADPQGYGSALTYLRRYMISALLGIVTEEDDDGNGASNTPNANRPTQNQQPRRPAQGNVPPQQPKAPPPQQESSHPALASLPKLDGVAYKVVNGNDGRTCITATGNTAPRKAVLQGVGFKWNAERKLWWRYADAA